MARPPYHQERSKSSYRRPYGGSKPPKKRILIVCEGKKTEPNYFKAFRITSVHVDVEGGNEQCPDRIVEYGMKKGKGYDLVWSVFDKDENKPQNFNRAFELIRNRRKYKIAYSNEAFELWYLLHFHYYNTGISRSRYKGMLTRLLGHRYKKNNPDMYQKLLSRQSEAIRNARRLLESYQTFDPLNNNPSTTVVDLVEELNKYVD